jgi:hypothetical protein
MERRTRNSIITLKHLVIGLCLPPYVGWAGVLSTWSYPSWERNPLVMWPIFMLLMVGWISIWTVLPGTILCVFAVARRQLSSHERGALIGFAVSSWVVTWMLYGVFADH